MYGPTGRSKSIQGQQRTTQIWCFSNSATWKILALVQNKLAQKTTKKVKGYTDSKVPLNVTVIEKKNISTIHDPRRYLQSKKRCFYASEAGSSVVKGSKGDDYNWHNIHKHVYHLHYSDEKNHEDLSGFPQYPQCRNKAHSRFSQCHLEFFFVTVVLEHVIVSWR